jgi:hypothetical protein
LILPELPKQRDDQELPVMRLVDKENQHFIDEIGNIFNIDSLSPDKTPLTWLDRSSTSKYDKSDGVCFNNILISRMIY